MNGSAAFWVRVPSLRVITYSITLIAGSTFTQIYSEFRFTLYPSLTRRINAYAQGLDPLHSVGPYWQQPGRSILENHLVQIPEGNEVIPGAFKDFERAFFTGPS